MANSLTRFDPFREIGFFDPFRDIDELLRDATRVGGGAPRMRMDVEDNGQAYLVKADIPGVSKEDIKVGIHGNQVSLSAEVKQEKDEGKSSGTLRSERYYGMVQRSFTLPQEVDEDQAEARYENGVLRLTLPKRQGGGGRQLSIQ
jgi:HSP20 family protein